MVWSTRKSVNNKNDNTTVWQSTSIRYCLLITMGCDRRVKHKGIPEIKKRANNTVSISL